MSEKISKISVDGVVYDIASTGGGEVLGDIQEQLSALENKVTEEASAREEGDAKLSEKIESEASRVDGMVNQINENVASSIETLNNNLVQAIETINNGIAAEVTNREEGDAKLQAAIDELAEKVNGEGADLTELEGKIEKNAADIATVNNNLVEAVNNINKNVADGFSTINGGLNNEIRPELEKAVKYEDVADSNLPERKAIVLKNGDVILGGNLEGGTSSLVQLNRWGVADFGSSSVPFNINTPKDVRPTVQEAGQSGEEAHKIAYLEDVESVSVALEDKQDKGDYALKSDLEGLATETWVESKGYLTEHQDISGLATKEEVTESSNEVLTNILGRIWTNTDKEESGNFDTSYKHADGSYARIWNETDGGGSQYYNSNKDTLSFVGVNDGNDGIHVQIYSKKKSTNVGARLNATPDGIFYGVGNSASIASENELVVKKDITEVNTNLEAEIEARSTADTQLQNDLQVEATTAREAEKANADAIVAEVSRATEKEAEIEANQIAYVSDVAGLSNTLEALNATVQILQSKVDVLTKTNTEVVSVDGSAGELKDSSKDYIVSGSINENAEIVGKSISLKSIKVSDNARLKLNAGDVEAKDLNISGSFPKANGNTVISVNNAEFIVFKDMVFDASEVYNGIEIGLASNSVLPKNILFDNCKFQGEFSNNAILVFGTQDNAIITLNNCYFEKISNALRLSNKSNASGVVVNINNCTVDQWETRAPWQGFLICEDYTNKTEEEVNANNLFGDGKITVNFNNLVHAGVKINPADPASVCGTKNESQVVMVCQDAVAGPEGDYCLSYDAAKFPVVSFK